MPKYWSFSFSISPINEYSVLISFRTDWFDLLAVQQIFTGCLLDAEPSDSIGDISDEVQPSSFKGFLSVCRDHKMMSLAHCDGSKESHKDKHFM